MSTKTEATIEDLYKVDGKAELVDGEIVHMSPTGKKPSYAAMQVVFSLHRYAKELGRGYPVTDGAGFVVNLPHRKSFSPDAAFYVGDMDDMKFYEGAPPFAVEVRSEGDYGPKAEEAMARKRADYFASGTQVVWDVDLLSETPVRVFRAGADGNPTVYRRGETAEAEPALPGWTMPVDDLFV
ncbi:MAG TPA: Uma2 family endonuclease [Pyrinomonadaceae bacterium]